MNERQTYVTAALIKFAAILKLILTAAGRGLEPRVNRVPSKVPLEWMSSLREQTPFWQATEPLASYNFNVLINRSDFNKQLVFKVLVCQRVIHLGESWEFTRQPHAKGDASSIAAQFADAIVIIGELARTGQVSMASFNKLFDTWAQDYNNSSFVDKK